MATELASAYITLIPSLKGAQSQIQRQLSGLDASSAGSGIGSSIGGELLSGVSGAITGIVGAIGSIGGALGALSMQGGITRALNLENAQHLFDGLGLSWERYKGIVNDAVQDTQFSLDQAATVAANLAASGVTGADDMSRALAGATGLASTFGAELTDIGGIYQKVRSQGRLTGDTIFQLSTRGVNATSILSRHLGKTEAEVSKMVSSGQIDFQTFSDAMYDSFGTSAKSANSTFSGAMANMRSALSRLGEKFASPVLSRLTDVFNALRPAINAVSTALEPLAGRFSRVVDGISDSLIERVERFTAALEDGGTVMDGLDAALGPVASKIAVVVGAIGGLGAVFGAASAAIGAFAPALGPVIGMLGGGAGLSGVMKGLQDIIGRVASAIGGAGAAASGAGGGVAGLRAAFGALGGPVGIVVTAIGGLVALFIHLWNTNDGFRQSITETVDSLRGTLGPAFENVKRIFGEMADRVAPKLQGAWEALEPALAKLFEAWVGMMEAISPATAASWELIATIIAGLAEGVATLAAWLAERLAPAFEALADFFVEHQEDIRGFFEKIGEGISFFTEQIWPVITGVIQRNWESTIAIFDFFGALLSGDWETIWENVKSALGPVWEAIKSKVFGSISGVLGVISGVLGSIRRAWSSAWDAVKQKVTSIWGGITSAVQGGVSRVLAPFRTIRSTITGFFSGAGSWLTSAGSNIIGGLASGISGAVKSKLGGVLGSVSQFIKDHKGPPSYDRVMLTPHGRLIIQGLISGMLSQRGALLGALGSITDQIAATDVTAPSVRSRAVASEMGAAGARTSGPTYTVVFNGAVLNGRPQVEEVVMDFFSGLARAGVMQEGV